MKNFDWKFALWAPTIAVALLLCPSTDAQPPFSGDEFRINTDDFSRQIEPVAAFNERGDFVVAWENQINGMTMRRFGAGPQPFSDDEIMVPNDPVPVPFTGRAFARREAAMAMRDNGEFYLLWTEEEAYLRVSFFIEHRNVRDTNLMGQRFNPAGQPVGAPFRVNKLAQGIQKRPRLEILPNGQLLALWESEDEGVYIRVLRRNGRGVTDDIRVDKGFDTSATRPSVAVDGDGNMLVAFEVCCDTNGDTGVFARYFDSDANAQGDAVQINTGDVDDQQAPAIAAAGVGRFLVTWQSPLDETRTQYRVFGQMVSDGALDGAEFQVSGGPGWGHSAPVAASNGSELMVAWLVWEGDFRTAVYGRQLDGDGNLLGDAFAVNQRGIGGQHKIGLAAGPAGSFLVTWIGRDEFRNMGIEGRMLGSSKLEAFCDGRRTSLHRFIQTEAVCAAP